MLVQVVGAQPQQLRVLSTIESSEPFAVVDVASTIKREGQSQWSFTDILCSDIGAELQRPPVAILTSSRCWRDIQLAKGVGISSSVGIPMYLFGLKGKGELKAGDRVGILISQDEIAPSLEAALSLRVGRNVKVFAKDNTEEQLVKGLGPEYDAIAIVEDGTGSSVQLMLDQGQQRNTLGFLEPITAGPIDKFGAIVPIDERIPTPAIAVPTNAVSSRYLAPRTLLPAVVVAVVLSDTGPDQARPARRSSAFTWLIPSGLLHAQPAGKKSKAPQPARLPILLTSGVIPTAFSEAFTRAQLYAPIETLVNPCRYDHEMMYRSFLRSANTSVSKQRSKALWEHATLLHERSPAIGQYSRAAEIVKEEADLYDKRSIVSMLAKVSAGAECKAEGQTYFATGSNSVAFYERGIDRLRVALENGSWDPVKKEFRPEFKEAASCLERALDDVVGEIPTCGAPLNSLWTTYYAPYLAIAVIDAEASRAR